MFHRSMQIVRMNDFDRLFHHLIEIDRDTSHYSVVLLIETMSIRIHLNHILEQERIKNKLHICRSIDLHNSIKSHLPRRFNQFEMNAPDKLSVSSSFSLNRAKVQSNEDYLSLSFFLSFARERVCMCQLAFSQLFHTYHDE